jgi:HEAT repeat protein
MNALMIPLALIPLFAFAQQPRVTNATLETRASAGLEREIRSVPGPAWIGYAEPAANPSQHSCCGSCGGGCGCALEGTGSQVQSSGGGPVRLEAREVAVLFRVERGSVEKIRTFSADCELDAGGLRFVWLTGVSPAESVRFLASTVGSGEQRLADSAIMAIAMHAGQEAGRQLEQFTAASNSERVREKTAFWLGAARGKSGANLLRRMMKQDPSEHVRDKVTFALSVSKDPDAVDALIAAARSDSSSRVRGQALFWLGQKAGKKAEAAITASIENDPETGVKRRAVFALSQLPRDEGVPLLIQVARTNRNPAVRKQAMFWLGQSGDGRALEFFEQVLKN